MFRRKKDPLHELREIPIDALADGVIMAIGEIARRLDVSFEYVAEDMLDAYRAAMRAFEKETIGD